MNPVLGPVTKTRRSLRDVPVAPAKVVRAAIYTRKSTDEGLDSAFNSLDAQREAGEAYVKTMQGEGWTVLPEHYDDGGFTGGNTDRPALQRLIAEVERGAVDAVLVYKIDRLSRSLLDFLNLIEYFEQHNISFVSVTQQINTATSAGKLMLHILASFASYERSIISERTRDKMHAARKRGQWIGGGVILGYRIDREQHKLVVDEEEALCVRELFNLYLNRRSLLAVVTEVNSRGWCKKRWIKGKGAGSGGPYDKVYLVRLLTNVTYIGKVTLKGQVFDGQQEAIIDDETFAQVQALLVSNRNGQKPGPETRNKHNALLRGLIKCGVCGSALGHTYTKKGNKLYRFYTCTTRVKQGRDACPTPPLSAPDIETFVIDQIRQVGKDPDLVESVFAEAQIQQEKEAARVKSERERLIKQKIQRDEEVRRLTALLVHQDESSPLLRRINAAEELSRTLTSRIAELDDRIAAGQSFQLDIAHLKATLAEFDALWDVMLPHEQGRLIHSLVQRIVCSPDGETRVEFRTERSHI